MVSLNPVQRRVGEIIMGIGVVHTVIGAIPYTTALRASVSRGWPGFLDTPPATSATSAEWFTVSGLALGCLGLLVRDRIQHDGTVSPAVAWTLIGSTIVCIAIEPKNGAYALLVPAGIILSVPRARRIRLRA